MELNEIKLEPAQLKEAVTLFASGLNRQEVASHLIDQGIPPIPEAIAQHGETEVRRYLSMYLRTTDPTSSKFSVKYRDHYLVHREAIMKSLEYHYQQAVTRSVQHAANLIEKLQHQSNELEHLLENATDIFPVGTSEYISTLNAKLNIEKRIHEMQEHLIARLEKIAQQNIP